MVFYYFEIHLKSYFCEVDYNSSTQVLILVKNLKCTYTEKIITITDNNSLNYLASNQVTKLFRYFFFEITWNSLYSVCFIRNVL